MKKMSRILVIPSLTLALGACIAGEEPGAALDPALEPELALDDGLAVLDPEKGWIQTFKDEDEPEPDADALAAEVDAPRPKAGVYDVGVIPDQGAGCPAGSDEIRIRMDDEDWNNGNSQAGWIGRTRSDGQLDNTLFVFCKVNGTLFRPLSSEAYASDLRDDYAVLKLGTTCPAGSQEFWRYFDNEDTNNGNYKVGEISPNISNKYGTKLYFCLFRYASSNQTPMISFPALGLRYGVFAPGDFNRGISLGSIRTDDQDVGNNNQFSAPSDALTAAKRIVAPDSSVTNGATFLRFARVR